MVIFALLTVDFDPKDLKFLGKFFDQLQVIRAHFLQLWHSSKKLFFLKVLAVFKSNLPPTDRSLQKFDKCALGGNFHVDFKDFIGYA